jgi:hypothetical protein
MAKRPRNAKAVASNEEGNLKVHDDGIAVEPEYRIPTDDELAEVHRQRQEFEKTPKFVEWKRIRSVAIRIEGFISRLDRYRWIDDAFGFGWSPPPGDPPERRPPAEERWKTAWKHYWDFLGEILTVMEIVKSIEGSQDVRVCLDALYREVLEDHDFFEGAAETGNHDEAIKWMKQILRRTRWTLRPALVLTCAKVWVASSDFFEGDVPPNKYSPWVTAPRLQELFGKAGLPNSWDTIKSRVDSGIYHLQEGSGRGRWSIMLSDLPAPINDPKFWQ